VQILCHNSNRSIDHWNCSTDLKRDPKQSSAAFIDQCAWDEHVFRGW